MSDGTKYGVAGRANGRRRPGFASLTPAEWARSIALKQALQTLHPLPAP